MSDRTTRGTIVAGAAAAAAGWTVARQTYLVWNALARGVDDQFSYAYAVGDRAGAMNTHVLYEAFARDTPRGAIVVDIGIGAGSPLCNAAVRAAIAERELTWIGIDIDAPGIALAAARMESFGVRGCAFVGDCTQLTRDELVARARAAARRCGGPGISDAAAGHVKPPAEEEAELVVAFTESFPCMPDALFSAILERAKSWAPSYVAVINNAEHVDARTWRGRADVALRRWGKPLGRWLMGVDTGVFRTHDEQRAVFARAAPAAIDERVLLSVSALRMQVDLAWRFVLIAPLLAPFTALGALVASATPAKQIEQRIFKLRFGVGVPLRL